MLETYEINFDLNLTYEELEGTPAEFVAICERIGNKSGQATLYIDGDPWLRIRYTTGDLNKGWRQIGISNGVTDIFEIVTQDMKPREMALRALDAAFQVVDVFQKIQKNYDETRIIMRIF